MAQIHQLLYQAKERNCFHSLSKFLLNISSVRILQHTDKNPANLHNSEVLFGGSGQRRVSSETALKGRE